MLNPAAGSPLTATFAEPNHAAERAAFSQQLAAEIERAARYGRDCSIALLDISHLRQINEAFGREAGDRLIAELSLLLEQQLRQSDCSFRYGGDEFVLLLPETDFAAASIVLRRVGERAARLWQALELPAETKLQYGIASFPQDAQSPKPLFLVADSRLRECKRPFVPCIHQHSASHDQ